MLPACGNPLEATGTGHRIPRMATTAPQPLPVRAAGLLLTTWCNARCEHCYVRSSPERHQWMTLEEARGHFAALARLGVDASGVHIGGGEPFGRFDLLIEVVRAARDVGLDGVGFVETNAAWATDDGVAADRLHLLREAGMRQISISADPFHQAFVDPECPVRLWRIARDVLGSADVRARRWRFLKAPIDLHDADSRRRHDVYRTALARYPERLNGRAADRLADLAPRRPIETFRGVTCTGSLAGSGHVHVLPGGAVFPGTCAGLMLGRATTDMPLDAVLAASRGPVWRTLVRGGPVALADRAADAGFHPDPAGYADKCHLCYAARRALVAAGLDPDELGPPELYAEA